MSILQKVGDTIRAGADVRIYGNGGARRSTRIQRGLLAGSHYDYATAAGALYDNGVVLPGINWKANAVSECELIVEQFDTSKGKWVRAIEKGAVGQILNTFETPNDYYDGMTLWHGIQLSWDCRGNSYMLKRFDRLGRPMGYYWCPHFQIRPLADGDNPDGTKLITRYEYTPLNGAMQYPEVSDVVHIRYGIDPRDPASGLAPLYGELRDVCTDNDITTWLAAVLRNGGTPGVIMSPKQNMQAPTPQQKQDLKSLWDSFVGDKRGMAFMAPVPVDVTTPAWSPKDMGIDKLRGIPTPRICAALGFDPMVIGLPSASKTYANYEQAADAAGKMTILPSIRKWAKQVGRQVLPDFKLDPNLYRLNWDISQVSWLQDDTDDLHDRVRKDYDAGLVDRFRAKEMIGEQPDASDIGVYATPLSEPQITDEEGDEDETAPAKTKQTKQRAHEAMVARARRRRQDYESGVR